MSQQFTTDGIQMDDHVTGMIEVVFSGGSEFTIAKSPDVAPHPLHTKAKSTALIDQYTGGRCRRCCVEEPGPGPDRCYPHWLEQYEGQYLQVSPGNLDVAS